MKKIILTMAVVLTATFANAQKGGSDDMKFGVKAGLVNSNFAGDFSGGDANTGFYIGGLVDFSVSEKFHVQPELLYSVEGAKDAKINFLRIPVMAKYYVIEGLSLQAGPEFGFKAGGDDIKDYAKSLDYGIGFGAGYELESGLMFDLRYNLGLADINDFPTGSGLEDAKMTTVSFNVGVGYRF
ncbi:porin family protein [Flavobacterium sp. XGLA_31]|uniref:porin family protein n=1 Tax=Flavobacterium sp. XGLA_31 TaxID=3447666 RepID=UPI003F39AAD6